MRVLFCGSRDWTDGAAIEREIRALPAGSTVIHGAARGADSLAGELARKHGLAVEAYPADWERFGRSAGPRRNQTMLEAGRPELVIAFTSDLAGSRGTQDMVTRARAAGVTVKVVGDSNAL